MVDGAKTLVEPPTTPATSMSGSAAGYGAAFGAGFTDRSDGRFPWLVRLNSFSRLRGLAREY